MSSFKLKPNLVRPSETAQPVAPPGRNSTPPSEKGVLKHGLTSSSYPYRLYNYLGPVQAFTLFVAGVAASVAFRWFFKGLSLRRITLKSPKNNLMDTLFKNANKEYQIFNNYNDSLIAALKFTVSSNIDLTKKWLKAYLGTVSLGYALGSAADGLQEVWVRREETQIRANLIQRLSANFRQSIQYKTSLDNQLRESAKSRILNLLIRFNIPQPEALIKPLSDSIKDPMYRYPYEPYHFAKPLTYGRAAYRFGLDNQPPFGSPQIPATDPAALRVMKAVAIGLGFALGCLGQLMIDTMRHASRLGIIKGASKTFYETISLNNLEALFLSGNSSMLLLVLGLTAAAKVGKMLIDGYREIEVTRHNAHTELRYQAYNWLALDPTFHRIAEEEALEEALKRLEEAIPYEYNNRKSLENRIQTILTNIGRNSAPKYFQMTPSVNLVAARS